MTKRREFIRTSVMGSAGIAIGGLFRIKPDIMTQPDKKVGHYRYRILALVFMATTINYFDRSREEITDHPALG
jgi:hypothetical protein